MLFTESSCNCMPKFKSVAPSFFFYGKSTLFLASFFLIQKGVWPYVYTYDIPLVTLILNIYIYIYGFVGLTSTSQA